MLGQVNADGKDLKLMSVSYNMASDKAKKVRHRYRRRLLRRSSDLTAVMRVRRVGKTEKALCVSHILRKFCSCTIYKSSISKKL